jgi:hypothetical protein
MQRGRQFHAALLVGTLALSAGISRAAFAAAISGAPDGWDAVDIKSTGGDTTVTGTGADAVWTLTGNGADIQGTADQFRFAYTPLTGDGGITARLLSQTGGDPGGWMKSGVMLRDSVEPGSLMASIHYGGVGKSHTSGNTETLYRLTLNKAVTGGAAPAADLTKGPIWYRAQRQGQNYQLLSSANGKDWKIIDQRTVAIDASKPVLAGLSDTAHGKPSLVATFDNVSVTSDIVQPNILAPPTNIIAQPGNGQVLLTYSTLPNALAYNIYRRVAGSKDPAVKVGQQVGRYGWFVDDNAGQGLANGTNFLYSVRTVTQSLADPTQLLEGDASGELLVMPQTRTNGLALFYFGTTTPGSVAIDNNVMTITASGADIWDQTQSGEFLATPIAGDYSIRATVLEQPTAKDKAGKAGPMIRGDALSDSRYAYFFASAGRAEEILFEGRTDYAPNGKPAAFSQTITKVADAKFPLTLMLSKTGGVVTAYQSLDGTNFTQAGTPVSFGSLPFSYTGIAATAHKDGTLVTAKFDASSIKIDAPYTPPAPAPTQ